MANDVPTNQPSLKGMNPLTRLAGGNHAEARIATKDKIDVRRFHVHERMSSLFEINLTAVSPNHDIDFEGVVGQPMTFQTVGPQTRSWAGVCSQLRQVRVEEDHLSTYELTLV